MSLIQSKLPHDAVEHLELNKTRTSNWNAMSMVEVLSTYIRARELAEPAEKSKICSRDHITVSEAFALNENPPDDHIQPNPKCHF